MSEGGATCLRSSLSRAIGLRGFGSRSVGEDSALFVPGLAERLLCRDGEAFDPPREEAVDAGAVVESLLAFCHRSALDWDTVPPCSGGLKACSAVVRVSAERGKLFGLFPFFPAIGCDGGSGRRHLPALRVGAAASGRAA
mmetsp:Transcript_9344/g.22276  ORF Transcript_9344/g.22276 Transcript_9344/m.22276 type:complete len:140 (-) Transcript_9344:19-438(-)